MNEAVREPLQVSSNDVTEATVGLYRDLLQEAVKRAGEWEASTRTAARRIDELEDLLEKVREQAARVDRVALNRVAEECNVGVTTVAKYVEMYFAAVLED